jgi:hypothetical protein
MSNRYWLRAHVTGKRSWSICTGSRDAGAGEVDGGTEVDAGGELDAGGEVDAGGVDAGPCPRKDAGPKTW